MSLRGDRTLGQWASDGFLPPALTALLYTEYFNVGPAAVNGWSLVHALSGVATVWLTESVREATLLHTAWELFQFVVGDNKFDRETAVDVTLDTGFFLAGFLGARSLSPTSRWWLLLLLVPFVPP
jgi:hypothetical protein